MSGADPWSEFRQRADVWADFRPPVAAAKPEPGFLRGVGLGVRDAAQGLLAVPSMAYDAVGGGINLLSGGLEAIGGPSLPRIRTARENIDAVANATGLPQPATADEKLNSSIVQNMAATLPTIGAGAVMQGANVAPRAAQMLAGNIPSQLAGAAGAGYVGELAAQREWHPLAQTGAALAGGVAGAAGMTGLQTAGRAAGAMLQPFSETGRQRMAADVLLRGAADPEGLQARLAQGLSDDGRRLPNAPVTTAQASRDPGLMLLESGMRSQTAPNTPTGMSPAVAIRNVEAQRNAARLAAIQALQDGSDPATRGGVVRGALGSAEDAMTARTDQLYGAVNQAERFPLAPIANELAAIEAQYFGPLSGGMPASLASLQDDVKRVLQRAAPVAPGQEWRPSSIMPGMTKPRAPSAPVVAPGEVEWRALQNLRSRAGEIAGEASRAGRNQEAAAASRILQTIDNLGGSPEWQAATTQRRAVGQAVGRDAGGNAIAGQILRTDRFGAPLLVDEQVAARALQSPGGTKQLLGAYAKALEDGRAANLPAEQIQALSDRVASARGALRGQFMDDLFNATATTGDLVDAAGNPSRFLSPAQFKRFFDKNAGVAREIFEPGQYLQLQRLARDFAESGMATRTVNAAGSNTAQNLSVGNMIARATNGLIDAGSPLGQTFAGAGGLMRVVYAAPEAATREILTRAMVDPKFAQMLLSRATPRSVDQAMRYMDANMMERLQEAAMNAGARSAVRTGLESALSQ